VSLCVIVGGSAGGHKHMGLTLRSRYDSMMTMQQVYAPVCVCVWCVSRL
jgi:hypothetical protein